MGPRGGMRWEKRKMAEEEKLVSTKIGAYTPVNLSCTFLNVCRQVSYLVMYGEVNDYDMVYLV